MTTFAEVAEGVRNTIATYTQALDDGRTDDVVATFCPDGVVEIEGMGRHEGHEALRAIYLTWKPMGAQRHLVANTRVTGWSDDEATAVSDVVFLFKGEKGWAVLTVGRYTDSVHRDGDRWLFHSRAGSFAQ